MASCDPTIIEFLWVINTYKKVLFLYVFLWVQVLYQVFSTYGHPTVCPSSVEATCPCFPHIFKCISRCSEVLPPKHSGAASPHFFADYDGAGKSLFLPLLLKVLAKRGVHFNTQYIIINKRTRMELIIKEIKIDIIIVSILLLLFKKDIK
jgi:hypothetical protein